MCYNEYNEGTRKEVTRMTAMKELRKMLDEVRRWEIEGILISTEWDARTNEKIYTCASGREIAVFYGLDGDILDARIKR